MGRAPATSGVLASREEHVGTAGARLERLFDNLSEVVTVLDREGNMRFLSGSTRQLLGRSATARLGGSIFDFVHPDDVGRAAEIFMHALHSPGPVEPFDVRMLHEDGSYHTFEVRANSMLEDPEINGIIVSSRDLTDRRRLEATLQHSEARFEQVFENAAVGANIVDTSGRFVRVNAAYCRMLGMAAPEILTQTIFDVSLPEDTEHTRSQFASLLAGDQDTYTIEKRLRRADGETVWAKICASVVRDDHGSPLYTVGLVVDTTDTHALTEQLAHAASHDHLTGLAGRSVLHDHLDRCRANAQRSGEHVAVLAVDLDEFKQINDRFGHLAGDEVLIEVARRLETLVRASDLIVRYGGDEFIIVLHPLDHVDTACEIAQRIVDALAAPIHTLGRDTRIGASIGIALASTDTCHNDDLLARADAATYEAKQRGKGQYVVFDEHHRVTDPARGPSGELETSKSDRGGHGDGPSAGARPSDYARAALEAAGGGYGLMRAVLLDGEIVDWEVLDANAFVRDRMNWSVGDTSARLSELNGPHVSGDFLRVPGAALASGQVTEATTTVPSPAGAALRHVTAVPLGGDVVATFTRDMSPVLEVQARATALTERVWDIVAVTDAEANITWVSPAAEPVLGYRPDDLIGRPALELIHPDDVEPIMERFAEVLADPDAAGYPVELRVVCADGSSRWFECIGANRFDDPTLHGMVVSMHDIDARYRSQRALEDAELRTRSILETAGDAIITVNERGMIDSFNQSAERIFGTTATDVIGSSYEQFLPELSAARLRSDVRDGVDLSQAPVEVRCRRAGGEPFPAHVSLSITTIATQTVYTVIVRDITTQKDLEHHLDRLAFYDDLTGLANRRRILQTIDDFLADRGPSEAVGVLFVDIDDFELVNDSLGHDIGDDILLQITERIRNALHANDVLGRVGGDQFVVACSPRRYIADLADLAATIMRQLRAPFQAGGQPVYITASIGVARAGCSSDTGLDLLRHADTAMHRAKAHGTGNVELFDEAMHTELAARLDIQSALQQAGDRDELRVYYQPILHLETQQLTHREALIRWQRPDIGLVLPAAFIDIAEATGLIIPIGEWILRQAVTDCALWQRDTPGVGVAVNVSPRQIELTDLAATVERALHTVGLAPELLTIEVTESVLLHDAEHALVVLQELAHLGVRIALDDFGTGYSSLTYLHQLPVNELKIDQSFIRTLTPETTDHTLIKTIIQLGHALQLDTVAEGIDTQHKLDTLKQLGCPYGQGFLFAQPGPLQPPHASST